MAPDHSPDDPDPIDSLGFESPFRMLVERAPLMLWSCRPDGTYRMLNLAWRHYRGLGDAEQTDDGWAHGIHPDDRESATARFREARLEPQVFTIGYRVRRADGHYRWVHDQGTPWFMADGRYLGHLGVCVDVTDQRASREASEATEQRLKQLVEKSNDMIYRIRLVPSTAIEYMGGAVQAITGVRPETFRDNPQAALGAIHPDDAPMLVMSVEQAVRLPGTITYRWVHPDGHIVWAEHHRMPVFDATGRIVALEGLARDITQRVQTERRLRESEEQLRQLAGRIQSAREEERAEVSRELHDQLGQTLTALKLDIGRTAAAFGSTAADVIARERLQSVLGLVDEGIATVKRISARLRPASLDHLGLTEAIRWEASGFTARTGIRCVVRANRQRTKLNTGQKTACFRIAQEALNNVTRHANASSVHVTITASDEAVELRIRDNGRGITADQIADPGSIGLLGMSERAAHVGGTFQVSGQRGKGTVVVVNVPLHELDARGGPR